MRNETYVKATSVIFAVVAIMHLYRLVTGDFVVSFGGFEIPQWVSLLGLAVAGYLAYAGYKLKK